MPLLQCPQCGNTHLNHCLDMQTYYCPECGTVFTIQYKIIGDLIDAT